MASVMPIGSPAVSSVSSCSRRTPTRKKPATRTTTRNSTPDPCLGVAVLHSHKDLRPCIRIVYAQLYTVDHVQPAGGKENTAYNSHWEASTACILCSQAGK